MVNGDEGFAEAVGERFGVEDADEEGAGEAWAFGDGDGFEVAEVGFGLLDGGSDYGDEVAEVLARGEFGDYASVGGVQGHLGGDYVGEDGRAGLHDGGGGFVAAGLDAEDEAGAFRGRHGSSLGDGG